MASPTFYLFIYILEAQQHILMGFQIANTIFMKRKDSNAEFLKK
jgi:hypothetical protein